MPRKKTKASERKIKTTVVENIHQETEQSLTVPDEDRVSSAVALANSIIDKRPAVTTTGRFPDLWHQTAEALDGEYSSQKQTANEIIMMTRKTTELMRTARDCAAENLMNVIEDLQKRGQIEIPKA
ncbi:hypothetical protein ACFL2Q_02330 [Thermodesulfobacteriota bacterium]